MQASPAAREALIAGSCAALLSAVVLVAAGRRQGAPVAPINAISHWIWGDPALRRDRASARHTLAGYVIHHAAALFWGWVHAFGWARARAAPKLPTLVAQAAATSAVAYGVDYYCTPRRLQPGYEARLSSAGLFGVYAAFAIGLAIGSGLVRRH
jgi:hypothetical protein